MRSIYLSKKGKRRLFFRSNKAAHNELEKTRSLFPGLYADIKQIPTGVGQELWWEDGVFYHDDYRCYQHTLTVRTKFGKLERVVYAHVP